MAINDVDVPNSDGWWLKQLYTQLIEQRAYCQRMLDRYLGDPPLPFVADTQKEAVKWFVGASRTNFEKLIVDSVLSRLRLTGITTAASTENEGDADAWTTFKNSRGKLWMHDVLRMCLSMSRAYVIVGKDTDGNLLVTAEDPRQVTAIVDPENPYKVKAALKVYYDYVEGKEYAYLYYPGQSPKVATADVNAVSPTVLSTRFLDRNFDWINTSFIPELEGDSFTGVDPAPWLAGRNGLPDLCCVVPFENQDGLSEFEPFLPLLDRINQQILQRMTIATVQAFRQRAFKGLPQKDPKTGDDINYDEIFVADPGAIWNIPEAAEIWESQQVDLQPILLAIRDDIKDLAAVSGIPLYSISPDQANGSAEGASLQREQLSFRVEARQDRFEISLEIIFELIFRTLGDDARSKPGTIEVMWAQVDRPSLSERASAVAQTTGVLSRFRQLTDIWGYPPTTADQVLSELKQDFIVDQMFSQAATPTAPPTPGQPAGAGPGGPGGALGAQQQKQAATAATATKKSTDAANQATKAHLQAAKAADVATKAHLKAAQAAKQTAQTKPTTQKK